MALAVFLAFQEAGLQRGAAGGRRSGVPGINEETPKGEEEGINEETPKGGEAGNPQTCCTLRRVLATRYTGMFMQCVHALLP